MSRGRSLELFFADGTPDGILTAEVFGWTGHILKAPRLRLKDALQRAEAAFTGVYLLLGAEDGGPSIYIGEAESVARRIRDHDAQKEWWQDAVFITASANSLNKAHVKYLEARLIQKASDANTMHLTNATRPEGSSINEAAQANMETFLDTLDLVLPAIGVEAFRSGKRLSDHRPQPKETTTPLFELETPKNAIHGLARLEGSDFLVLEGSVARQSWAGKGVHDYGYKLLHEKLVQEGVLEVTDTHAVFARPYAFNSPSAAAAVMNGRPANGRIEWRLKGSGLTFADWEQAQLAEASL